VLCIAIPNAREDESFAAGATQSDSPPRARVCRPNRNSTIADIWLLFILVPTGLVLSSLAANRPEACP
jgi:hypothetical protein